MHTYPDFILNLSKKYDKQPVQVAVRLTEEEYTKQKQKQLEYPIKAAAIGIVWINDTQLILTKRSGPHAGWALPGGRIEMTETIEQGFVREIVEEAGVEVNIVDVIALEEKTFISPLQEKLSLWLVSFVARTKKEIHIKKTKEAELEGIIAEVFSVRDLPHDMVTSDREKIITTLNIVA